MSTQIAPRTLPLVRAAIVEFDPDLFWPATVSGARIVRWHAFLEHSCPALASVVVGLAADAHAQTARRAQGQPLRRHLLRRRGRRQRDQGRRHDEPGTGEVTVSRSSSTAPPRGLHDRHDMCTGVTVKPSGPAGSTSSSRPRRRDAGRAPARRQHGDCSDLRHRRRRAAAGQPGPRDDCADSIATATPRRRLAPTSAIATPEEPVADLLQQLRPTRAVLPHRRARAPASDGRDVGDRELQVGAQNSAAGPRLRSRPSSS